MKDNGKKQGSRRRGVMAAVLTAVLLLGGCGAGEETQPAEGDEIRPEKAVVQVKAGSSVGSAVLKGGSPDGETLELWTAAHVLETLSDGEQPTVLFADGTERSCDVRGVSDSADVALLTVSDAELVRRLEEEGCFIREDRERFDRLQDGDGCVAIGGEGEERTVCTGEVLDNWIYMEDYGQYMIWADVRIYPGMSGGGLFDDEGYFLGILSGGSEDGHLAAVPYSLILSEFHKSSD